MAKKIMYPVLAALGIAVASGAAWWYQSQPKQAQRMPAAFDAPAAAAPARAAGVEVAKVERVSLRDDAQSVGTLRSRQSVMLRPEVAGRVKALGFRDGEAVRKGRLLVQLDDTLQRAELRQAQAQLSIATAALKRNQELVAQNFVAQRVLEESAANVQVVEAQLALASARLARMAILAPFDGMLGLRSVNLGDFVKDGAELVNLEDTSSMYVDFRLPERYQGKLKLQQTVELTLDAVPGRAFKARVDAIDPLLDANGRSVSVRALLPNTLGEPAQRDQPVGAVTPAVLPAAKPGASAVVHARTAGNTGPLRPGMFVRVSTVFSVNAAALVVPEEAIVPQAGRQFVFKVVAPSALPVAPENLPPETQFVSQRQEVKLGVRRQGKVQITEGLSAGQTVVLAGQQRLQKDGTPLRVVELERPASGAAPAAGPAAAAAAPALSASR